MDHAKCTSAGVIHSMLPTLVTRPAYSVGPFHLSVRISFQLPKGVAVAGAPLGAGHPHEAGRGRAERDVVLAAVADGGGEHLAPGVAVRGHLDPVRPAEC